MKIDDIFVESSSRNIDLRPIQIKGVLSVQNFGKLHQIGGGIEATVFLTRSANAVLKVVPLDDISGSGFIDFLHVVSKNPDNEFFPKIHKARIYEDVNGDLTLVVKMEKLVPFSKQTGRLFDDLFLQIGLEQADIEVYTMYQDPWFFSERFDNKKFRDEITARSSNPEFVEAMRQLEPLFMRWKSDLKPDNWMVRMGGGEPQLVIVDPFYNYPAT